MLHNQHTIPIQLYTFYLLEGIEIDEFSIQPPVTTPCLIYWKIPLKPQNHDSNLLNNVLTNTSKGVIKKMSYSNPPPPPPPPATPTDRLSTIKTYILIAFIFNIIALIGWIIAAVAFLFTIIFAIPFLVLFVLAILVFLRVYRMYNAVNAGDIATLKANSDMLWAVIALIFAGVIPGIMLIIADGPIKQL